MAPDTFPALGREITLTMSRRFLCTLSQQLIAIILNIILACRKERANAFHLCFPNLRYKVVRRVSLAEVYVLVFRVTMCHHYGIAYTYLLSWNLSLQGKLFFHPRLYAVKQKEVLCAFYGAHLFLIPGVWALHLAACCVHYPGEEYI